MEKTLYRVSAFSYQNRGGNEAGVVLDADHLSDQAMQAMAKQVGFSETAFLMTSTKADYKIRYFTPLTEVPLCGHATIGTFNLMRNLDQLDKDQITIETNAGILNVSIKADAVFMDMAKASIEEGPSKATLLNTLKLKDTDLEPFEPMLVSTGVKEIFAAVKTKEILHQFNPDILAIQRLCEQYGASGLYLFTLDSNMDAQGRNFLPVLGIPEESATGTASGSLAYYLYTQNILKQSTYQFAQGISMNKPSRILVTLKEKQDADLHISVGGTMRFIDKTLTND